MRPRRWVSVDVSDGERTGGIDGATGSGATGRANCVEGQSEGAALSGGPRPATLSPMDTRSPGWSPARPASSLFAGTPRHSAPGPVARRAARARGPFPGLGKAASEHPMPVVGPAPATGHVREAPSGKHDHNLPSPARRRQPAPPLTRPPPRRGNLPSLNPSTGWWSHLSLHAESKGPANTAYRGELDP